MTLNFSFNHPLLAPTGRVKSFIEDPNKGVLPASCTMVRLKDNSIWSYGELFKFVQTALVTGAGVSVHLSTFKPYEKAKGSIVSTPEKSEDILSVQDSMNSDPSLKGDSGIIFSSGLLYHWLMCGKKVYIDTSLIRPEGTIGSKGQVASGPDSFMEVFKAVERFAQEQTITSLLGVLSKFNETIRRGGVYKNGAVVTSLPIWHQSFKEYAYSSSAKDHPYLFKSAIIPKNWTDYLEEISYCLERVNEKDLWLEKCIHKDDNVTWLEHTYSRYWNYATHVAPNFSNTLGHNVCKEVLLKSNGTCIIMPLNLGMAQDPQDIILGAVRGMRILCEFQQKDFQSKAGIYLSAQEDKQVGLGLMGLANLLANHGISYQDFTDTLEAHLDYLEDIGITLDGGKTLMDYDLDYTFKVYDEKGYQKSESVDWVRSLIVAFQQSAMVAKSFGMDRAFAIAPTASVSFRYKDFKGYTVCPEYSPPLARSVERLSLSKSGLDGVYQYPPNVEIAANTPKELHFNLTVALQKLMDMTGLGHAISWNVWDELDYETLEKFLDSPLKSTYYLWETDDQSFLDKSNQVSNSCGVPIKIPQ